MGKSCVRFKTLDDVAVDVIGRAIKRLPVEQYIEQYERQLTTNDSGKKVSKKRAAGKKK